MANRRPQQGNSGRRMDFHRGDGRKMMGRGGVSPWQGGGPGAGLPNLLPLGGGSTEATLALASNIINLLQPRQNPVPSLLDMPIRREFNPQMSRFDRGYAPNRMGNQGNFRRTGNYNRAGERINTNRKQFKPNDGQKQQNKNQKKEADSKAKPVKESDNEEMKMDQADQAEAKDEKEKKDPPKTRYDNINPQLLKCHICNKSMWDGRSFDNHLIGRAHAIMMQKTAQSYALTADTMRQEFKIREMKRTRRTGQQPTRDFYCAMCDMYAADGALHRTTVGHRKLKKYLHPTCTACHKEMPTRIELDEHRLTPEHLLNMQDKQDVVTKPKPEVMVISTLNMEKSYLREERHRKRRGDKDDDKREDDGDNNDNKDADDNQEGEVTVKTEPGTEEKKPDKKDVPDTDKTVLDYKEGDDLTNVTPDMIPVYSTKRGVGQSFLSEFRCVQCRLCHKLLDGDETAQVHLRTWKHHQLFVKMLQPQTSTQESKPSKRAMSEDEDGDCKRRKTDDGADHNGELHNKDLTKVKEENVVPPEDELEDWEQSVDEILNDEKEVGEDVNNEAQPEQEDQGQEQEPEMEPQAESQPEPEEEPEKAPERQKTPEIVKPVEPLKSTPVAQMKTASPRGSPNRGRGGRGRGRGRGRY